MANANNSLLAKALAGLIDKEEGRKALEALTSLNAGTAGGAVGAGFEAGGRRANQASVFAPGSPQELAFQILGQLVGGNQNLPKGGMPEAQAGERKTSLSKPNPEDQMGPLDKVVAGVAKKAMKTQAEQALEREATPEALYDMAQENGLKSQRLNTDTAAVIPGGRQVGVGISEENALKIAKQEAFQRGEGTLDGRNAEQVQFNKDFAGPLLPLFKLAQQTMEFRTRTGIDQANRIPLSRAKKEEFEQITRPLEIAKAELELAKEKSKLGRLDAGELFKSFETASKPFVEVRDGFGRMQNALTNPQTGKIDFTGSNPAADLDLLFGTAKTLDPGGRVTDSDIAIQQASTGAYGDKIKKIAQKFQRRGFLAPEERKALFEAARRRFESSQRQQEQTVRQFENLGRRSGIPPENFIRDVGLAQGNQSSSNGMQVGRFLVESA